MVGNTKTPHQGWLNAQMCGRAHLRWQRRAWGWSWYHGVEMPFLKHQVPQAASMEPGRCSQTNFSLKKNHKLQEALLKESVYLMLHNGAPWLRCSRHTACGWPDRARRLLTEDVAAIPKAEPPSWVMAALQGQRTCPVTTMGLTSVSICRGTQGTTEEQSEPKDGYFPAFTLKSLPQERKNNLGKEV